MKYRAIREMLEEMDSRETALEFVFSVSGRGFTRVVASPSSGVVVLMNAISEVFRQAAEYYGPDEAKRQAKVLREFIDLCVAEEE